MFELNQATRCGNFISSRATAAPQTGRQNEVAVFQLRPNKTLLPTQRQAYQIYNKKQRNFQFQLCDKPGEFSKVHESTFLGGVEWDYLCEIKLRQKANSS